MRFDAEGRLTVAGVAGVVLLLASVPLFSAALILVWRGLEIAEVQSGAVRRERRAWERPEPGARSPAAPLAEPAIRRQLPVAGDSL
jgi:hypothetical protein